MLEGEIKTPSPSFELMHRHPSPSLETLRICGDWYNSVQIHSPPPPNKRRIVQEKDCTKQTPQLGRFINVKHVFVQM